MQKGVTLNPGDSQRVSFSAVPTAEGVYDVVLDGLSGQFSAGMLAVPVITIEQMFIATRPFGYKETVDDDLYIQIRNNGTGTVSGVLNIYDWQAWWGDPPGDDRRWKYPTFTLAPGEAFSYHCGRSHKGGDTTYIRAEVVVGNVIITETPRAYFDPGKIYEGSERIAVGECNYMAPGLAVLWYSQYSECRDWDGAYHTPTVCYPGECLHYERIAKHDTDDYDHQSWPAVFLVIMDPNFISGAKYHCHISGGPTANRTARFDFIFTG